MNLTDRSKAIFLDRDGVVNKEVGYLSNPDEFELLAGTVEALRILKGKGYMLIIITNQAGIARGYYTKEILDQIHKKMKNLLKDHDIVLDDIFYCPHHPDFTGPCNCRKPKTGMITKAQRKHNIDLSTSFMVGDTLNDVKTGLAANCKTVLVLTGYGSEEQKKIDLINPDFIYENLLEFAKSL